MCPQLELLPGGTASVWEAFLSHLRSRKLLRGWSALTGCDFLPLWVGVTNASCLFAQEKHQG